MVTRVLTPVLLAVIAGLMPQSVITPTYIQFDPYTVKGALYRPREERMRNVAVLLIHRVNNYLGHGAAWELAERGFLVLAMNSRFDNNEASIIWEVIAQDVKTGIEYLRKQPGIRKIVLFGHSGGAATLSFCQAVAEKGLAYCQAPGKITSCGPELANLPKADGLILVDASLGNPIGLLRGLNPAVRTEGDPKSVDPTLDPFNPANGYNSGGSTYSPEFKAKYYAAQSARMNQLIAMATVQASQLGTPRAPFPDDNVFLIVRASGARLVDASTHADSTTSQPRKHLKNNEKVVTEVVRPVRPRTTTGTQAVLNSQFEGGARLLTLKSFLTANAIRSTNAMTGIDWCSSNNSTPCAVGSIGIPLLVAAMGGNTGIRDNEMLYEMSASQDKDFVVVEGATHNIEPCTECEAQKGQYNNATSNFFNYVSRWISSRF
jgi:pimeloyl-ACP methyl ester carboxylesterase